MSWHISPLPCTVSTSRKSWLDDALGSPDNYLKSMQNHAPTKLQNNEKLFYPNYTLLFQKSSAKRIQLQIFTCQKQLKRRTARVTNIHPNYRIAALLTIRIKIKEEDKPKVFLFQLFLIFIRETKITCHKIKKLHMDIRYFYSL